MKQILKYLMLLILGIIIAMALIPFLFKGQIIEQIEKYTNQNLNAELSFEDVSLSFFRSFPHASVRIEDIHIKGKDQFEDITLFKANSVDLATNIKSVIADQSNLELLEFHLNKPIINIIVEADGKANYDITKPTEENNESSDMKLSLREYSINDAKISYVDKSSQLIFKTENFNQSGRGNFTADIINLVSKNDISKTNLTMEGIPYLTNASISGPLTLEMNIPEEKYTLKDNDIALNNIKLSAEGFIDLNGDDMMMDMDIESKDGKFIDFLSLVPNVYFEGLPKFDTKGNASIKAKAKGIFNSTIPKYPAIDVAITAQDGYLNSPDLPEPIKDFNFELFAKAQRSDWSDLEINIPGFRLITLDQPFSGKLNLANAMTNAHAIGECKGSLDLKSLSKIFNLEDYDVKSGSLDMDLSFDAKQRDLENERYENVRFDGTSSLTNFNAYHEDYKEIKISNVNTNFNPQRIEMNSLSGNVGKSDFSGDVSIDNPMAYFLTDKKMKGNINLRSKTLDLTPFVSDESNDAEEIGIQASADDEIIRQSELAYNVQIDEIIYPDYKIENVRSSGNINADLINLNKTTLKVNDQGLSMDGNIKNAYDYIVNDEKVEANVNISGRSIDLNSFMSEGTSSSSESGPIYIPKNVNSNINANFKQVIYDTYTFNDLKGSVNVDDGKALLKGIAGNVMEGYIKMDGLYDTSDEKVAPAFDMKYDLSQWKWSETFASVTTFQKLAPIGEFIDGLFNSTLTFSGKLDDSMFPDLSTISAQGFIHTLDGAVKGMVPLQKIGDKLGIAKLSNFKIEDTKNWFTVENGFVEVQPFDFDIDEMKFKAGGKHGIDQSIDYVINATIPRELMRGNKIGNVADKGIDFIVNEANKKGVNIDAGDFIYMDIILTGSIKNPKIKIIPKGSGGQTAKDIVRNEIDNVKQTVEDTIRKTVDKKVKVAKEEVMKKTDVVVDKAKEKANQEKDKAVEKGKEVVKEKVGTVIDSAIGSAVSDTLAKKVESKIDDVLGDKADKEIDKIKDKLGKWDPFKKKKGGGR